MNGKKTVLLHILNKKKKKKLTLVFLCSLQVSVGRRSWPLLYPEMPHGQIEILQHHYGHGHSNQHGDGFASPEQVQHRPQQSACRGRRLASSASSSSSSCRVWKMDRFSQSMPLIFLSRHWHNPVTFCLKFAFTREHLLKIGFDLCATCKNDTFLKCFRRSICNNY